MYKYDKLLESLSSNQEIPGQLGNNIGGVTNLDLTGQEELLTSGLYDDGWDESSSSGFEDLPLDVEDIILDTLCEASLMEHRGKSKDPNYQRNKKAAKIAGGVALTAGAILGGKKLLKNRKATKTAAKAAKAAKATKTATKAAKAAKAAKATNNPHNMSTKDFSKALSSKNTIWDI